MVDPLPHPPSLAPGDSLFLDFDGTLAEFVDPDALPEVDERLRTILRSLSERLEARLAIVSGRTLDNLIEVVGFDALDLSGSHGHERRSSSGVRHDPDPHENLSALHAASREFALAHGLVHEEKPAGSSLHYRGVAHAEDRVRSFAESIAEKLGFDVLHGAMVAEVRVPGRDKGDAVRQMMTEEPYRQGRPIFVGDDLTDEDGFAAASALGGWGILVGPLRPTRARYRLPDVAAVIRWLAA